MTRIRSIKPEYWSDEKMAAESDCCRMLFLALLSMADDFGRLIDNEKQIEAFVFPLSERSRDTRETLARLSAIGRIRRGTAENGQRVIEIVNWSKHQRVDKPSGRGALPQITVEQEVNKPSRKSRESLAKVARKSRETLAMDQDQDQDQDQEGDQEQEGSLPADAEAAPRKMSWLTPYLDLWHIRVGALTPKRAAAALGGDHGPYKQHGADALLRGLEAYLDQPRDPDKPVKIEYFAEKAAVWVKLGAMPLVDPVTRALRPGA